MKDLCSKSLKINSLLVIKGDLMGTRISRLEDSIKPCFAFLLVIFRSFTDLAIVEEERGSGRGKLIQMFLFYE